MNAPVLKARVAGLPDLADSNEPRHADYTRGVGPKRQLEVVERLRGIVPEGSLLNPVPPAAVVAGNVETSQLVVDALFIDHVDAALAPEIQTIGPTPICSAILMRDLKDKTRMAREIVDFHHDHARKGAAA